jgi:glutathione S-transferase
MPGHPRLFRLSEAKTWMPGTRPGMTKERIQEESLQMYHYTALVTCLAILFYFYTSILVSKARGKFGVKLPAISGHPDFERVFRVQMNTLEWMPIFLPSLWLFAIYISDGIAAAFGAVWIIGRVLYVIGYSKATEKRGPGFAVQFLAAAVLWVGALGGIVWRIMNG